MKTNLLTLALITMLILLFWASSIGIDQSIDNQNRMLCRTAKETRNWEYIEKCREYYATGNIEYLR